MDALTAAGYRAQISIAPIAEALDDRWSGLRAWWESLPPLHWPGAKLWKRLAVIAAVVIFVLPPIWVALYGLLPVPITPLMIERWLGGASITQDWASFDELSPNLVDAVIAGETKILRT